MLPATFLIVWIVATLFSRLILADSSLDDEIRSNAGYIVEFS